MSRKSRAKPPSPFRYFHSSPEVIRLVVMLYVRFPLSLRNVEDLLIERSIDLCHGKCQIDGARIATPPRSG
jgi:putative transposase